MTCPTGTQSERVLHCYATLGAGCGTDPQINSAIRILAINAARETQWVDAYYCSYKGFVCEALRGNEWRLLGYVQADGTKPLGPLDAVDPQLVEFDRLPLCNSSAAPMGKR